MEPVIRNISDTARWVAWYRAQESDRPDAVFHDGLARRLAGERGERIARTMGFSPSKAWPFVARTWLFDRLIVEEIADGASVVVNLAAGFDTRPYRLELPASLRWVEIDLPELIAEKQKMLANERPHCRLERIGFDLADETGRRSLFGRLADEIERASRSGHAVVICEGLLIYLDAHAVDVLATDLAETRGFDRWIIDLVSPGLLKMLERRIGTHLEQGGVPFKFAPLEGAEYFARFGWTPRAVSSIFKTARTLKRLPWFLRLMSYLPEPKRMSTRHIWSGVCVLARTNQRV